MINSDLGKYPFSASVAYNAGAGDSYETIVEETGASTATISRVKRCLVYGADGYTVVLDRLTDKK